MICPHCATQLKPALVHALDGAYLRTVAGYECPRCFALYDMAGVEIEAPLEDEYGAIENMARRARQEHEAGLTLPIETLWDEADDDA